MILGALAPAAYSWVVCILHQKFRMSSLTATIAALVVWSLAANRGFRFPVWRSMIIRLKRSALRETSWGEYLVRFAVGGAMTVVAGLIAASFGPVLGGLFLAFPAIFPPARRSSKNMSANTRSSRG